MKHHVDQTYPVSLTWSAGRWFLTSVDDVLSLPPKVTKYFRDKTKVLSAYQVRKGLSWILENHCFPTFLLFIV